MADIWDRYMESTTTENTIEKIKILMECFKQDEDKIAQRVAAHDLGHIFYTGSGVPEDKERGKKLMKVSAELGHPEAMNLYGQMLTHDGNTECISYFCMALEKAQITAAKNLNTLLISFQKAGNTTLCNAVEAGVAEVARISLEDKADNLSEAYLTLALIGLYGLGVKCGISVEQGEAYLQKAAEAGHPYAEIIGQDPNLKYPQAYPYQTAAAPVAQKEEEKAPVGPFGWSDVVTSLVVGAVGGLLINWIFKTGFWIPFLVVGALFCGILYIGSDHDKK